MALETSNPTRLLTPLEEAPPDMSMPTTAAHSTRNVSPLPRDFGSFRCLAIAKWHLIRSSVPPIAYLPLSVTTLLQACRNPFRFGISSGQHLFSRTQSIGISHRVSRFFGFVTNMLNVRNNGNNSLRQKR